MTELSVLERVRAAVAEAGYDPAGISVPEWLGQGFAYDPDSLPDVVVWKARELVAVNEPLCWACAHLPWPRPGFPECRADRRFVEDCGRDRGEP